MNQEFDHQLYGQFARVGKAVSNGHRIALLDLLVQGERSVEILARLAGLSMANTSQHLQLLRNAGLVRTRKDGQHVFYRLSDERRIAQLLEAVQTLAHDKLSEVGKLIASHMGQSARRDTITAKELADRLNGVTLIDLRPEEEFATGHIPGACNMKPEELAQRYSEIGRDREVVLYCRSAYSLPAAQATAGLRARGIAVRRLSRGFTEWRMAGLPVEGRHAVDMALA